MRVQPERGRAGQDPDAVMAPDRGVVHDPFGVVPHPVGIDHPAADGLGDRQHRPVDVVRDAGDQVRRRLPPAQWPITPDQVEIAADAATGHHHGLSGEAELPDRGPRGGYPARQLTGFQDRSRDAYARRVDLQRGHLVPRPDPHPTGVQQGLRERLDHGRPGAPGDVEPWHRIAVTRRGVAATFGPLDQRKPPDAEIAQPAALLPGREVHVRLGPAARPVVLRPVVARAAQPVSQGQLLGVVDP